MTGFLVGFSSMSFIMIFLFYEIHKPNNPYMSFGIVSIIQLILYLHYVRYESWIKKFTEPVSKKNLLGAILGTATVQLIAGVIAIFLIPFKGFIPTTTWMIVWAVPSALILQKMIQELRKLRAHED